MRTAVFAALAAGASIAPAGAQVPPVRDQPGSVRTADVGRYEFLYGAPIYWSLSFLVAASGADLPPKGTAIRTRGVLAVQPRPRANPQVKLCEETMIRCLDLSRPAPEIADVFFEDMPFRGGDEAEIVGAFTDEGFLFWSYTSAPRLEKSSAGAERSLEELIANPGRFVGREIAVRGRFGGANLFDDFPPGTRRAREDWVLRDPPFSLWITAVDAGGEGWRLDPAARRECAWRLRVEGLLERHDGVLYLKARRVHLLGRDADESCGVGPP